MEEGKVSRSDQESRTLLRLSPGRRMTKTRLLIVLVLVCLYALTSATYVLGMKFLNHGRSEWVVYALRPLPLTLLLVVVPVYAEYNKKTLMYAIWIFIGLVCCLAGDILFLLNIEVPYANSSDGGVNHTGDVIFIYGLLCYMLGKLFYTVAFTIGVGKEHSLKIFHSIPFYAYGGMVIALVYTQIGDEFAYLVIYMFVSSTMGWRALALTSSFPGSDRARLFLWLSVVGSAMLIACDTLVIYDAYYRALQGYLYYVTSIYLCGQLLITFSVPRRLTYSDHWLHHFTEMDEDF